MVQGVGRVTSGYAGGYTENPTYEHVSAGITGHAEVVEIEFDPAIISYADLLEIFWTIHNPTTRDRQDSDVGSQYRSIILYENEEQLLIAKDSKAEVAKLWADPIVTEIVPLKHFYRAEDYHQDYFRTNPERAYCQVVINPKLAKLREKFASRLKA